MMTKKLIIFAKYPHPGKSKTRLAPVLGADGAAQMHKVLVEYTLSRLNLAALSHHGIDVEIRFTGASPSDMEGWLGLEHCYIDQGIGDLGARLERAFSTGFHQGRQKVIAIGTDTPAVDQACIHQAIGLLDHADVVLGPSVDGGYYLIGLRVAAPRLFANIPWGSSGVLKETQKRATQCTLSVRTLQSLPDIDRPEDLHHLPNTDVFTTILSRFRSSLC